MFRVRQHLVLLLLSLLVVIEAAQDTLYNEAIEALNQLSQNFTRSQIYNIDNIEGNLYIPQFNPSEDDYDRSNIPKHDPPHVLTSKIVPLLEKSAFENSNSEAYATLGDLYLFGNYSFPTDYTRARDYYHKSVNIGPNGHAYFMLGYIYSTGLFGTFPPDQERGNLYYHFGMKNGDLNAMLVVAYKTFKGIGVPQDCELALSYYTSLAEHGKKWMATTDLATQSKYFNDLRNSLEEYKLNANEHVYTTLYYNGLESYKGDYFVAQNLTKAFELFQECVALGDEIYGASNYQHVELIDKIFLSACQSKLGRMYLKGFGVEKDVKTAQYYLKLAVKLLPTAEALNDLAYIEEEGLLGEANYTKAVEYYTAAIKKRSGEANKNLSKLLMKINGNDAHTSEHAKDIYNRMKDAVYYQNTEALYYVGDFIQSGLAKAIETTGDPSCSTTISYYAVFVERLSQFYAPHLKYAFEELVTGNYKNALVGYLIAAEQGFEPAQVSAAYLLFQLQPLQSKMKPKTFSPERVEIAVQYLDRASKQANVDATILLGDIYSGQQEQITPDYDRAFNYYQIASDKHSSHGSYKLAEMYEYGYGPVNDSVDYFMAKRYYDSSLQYKEKFDYERREIHSKVTYSRSHIDWALLRLRFKYLFNRKAFKDPGNSDGGWISAFNNVGKRASNERQQKEAISKAEAHHEGTSYNDEYVEDYDVGDYLVIALTFSFFMIFFVQNILRQIRRMRAGPGNNDNNDDENDNNNQNNNNNNNQNFQNGWNGNQFNFRRGNFEFHFFAI
ncbi:ERAD-associated E3 ubiquitin-protein ligase component HRD3 [Candida viswanathii]|uniref:ERAD-associated E3 ubiquitin-protein ligase component HRD3 n=1 Tax=Candida viswanathii TaxID=5486 RepID=A0A367XX17_9ASCO|nr:ERAD-associated E3 ubiquitin-protein ligase component HRD3 [Candida viswanathii]